MSPSLISTALASLLLFESAYSAAIITQRADPKWGECTDPTIAYVKDVDGIPGYGYKPANQKDFPHGASPDVGATIDFICGRLQNECRAPEAATLCRLAALAGKAEKDQKAADVFNESLKTDISEPSQPKPEPEPQAEPQAEPKPRTYNIETSLSSRMVEFEEEDVDLRWWFDNHMLTGDASDGAICPRDDVNMGQGKSIKFSCSFPDGSVEKLIRAAMNELIQTSVTSDSIPLKEKPFARFTEKRGTCNRGGCPESKPYSKFAANGEMRLFNLTGERNEEQGFLQYEIIDNGDSGACKACEYFGGAQEGAEAVGAIIGDKLTLGSWGGLVGSFTGVVSLTCLLAC